MAGKQRPGVRGPGGPSNEPAPKKSTRNELERRSFPLLAFFTRVPKWLLIVTMAGLLFAGFGIYLWKTKAVGRWGRLMPWIVMAGLLVFQYVNWFGTLPADPFMVSTLVLLTYALCAGGAWLLDRTRA